MCACVLSIPTATQVLPYALKDGCDAYGCRLHCCRQQLRKRCLPTRLQRSASGQQVAEASEGGEGPNHAENESFLPVFVRVAAKRGDVFV